MSEYQFYDFAAVDAPISDEGLRYARQCSRTAIVSNVRWQNTYNYDDFRGSVATLLKYYDAHYYIANWGLARLMLAFPSGTLSGTAIQPYLQKSNRYEATLAFKEKDGRCIVSWERNEEGGWGWTHGDGVLDHLIGIREELTFGDHRALFLGWLSSFNPEEWLEGKIGKLLTPPIPPGLSQLSPAQLTLLEQFPVDPDALGVATELSPTNTIQRIPLEVAFEQLSVSEMQALLRRVAEGGGSSVRTELKRLTLPQMPTPVGQPITCIDFANKVIEARTVREKKEAEAALAKKQRKDTLRQQHLTSVLSCAEATWSGFGQLMDQRSLSIYDQVATQLQDLRDAYRQAGDSTVFDQRISDFRKRYSNRPAMLRRIRHL